MHFVNYTVVDSEVAKNVTLLDSSFFVFVSSKIGNQCRAVWFPVLLQGGIFIAAGVCYSLPQMCENDYGRF